MQQLKPYFQPILLFILALAGIAHFVAPQEFAKAIPPDLSFPYFWVYLTGAIEFLAIVGLLIPKWRRLTAYLLVAYFIALLPAHFEMLIKDEGLFGFYHREGYILRVFMQLIPIFLAWEIRHANVPSVFPLLDKMDKALLERWQQPYAWHSKWLWVAAWYNLGFGFWVGLFPNQAFLLLGMDLPTYPFLWQCIGMIVGVYGIGYAIAAFDEMTHYPIVLVGMLGKIFGPLGFIYTFWTGQIALSFGILLLFNDLIWYPSFLGILKRKYEELVN